MGRKAIGLAGIVLVLALGILFWPSTRDGEAFSGFLSGASGSAGADGMANAAALPSSFTTGLEGLPGSLRDTEVDGELEVDANGNLRITNGIRRVFDYFLSATGEEPLESILARIRAYIRHKLPAGPAAEAEKILDGYIAYKRGLESVEQASPPSNGQMDLDAVRRQMEQVRALRTQYLSQEVIIAFFGDEDAYDRYTLARLDVMQNKQLTAAARAQQLAALEQQLPPALQESMKAISQYQNLQSLTEDWQKRKGTSAELRQIRENLVGPEATDRLEALDKERAEWGQRMTSWLSERAAITTNTSMSEQDRQRQVEAARLQRFQSAEIVRVESLERMQDRGEKLPF